MMKKLTLVLVALCFTIAGLSQAWEKNLPEEKVEAGTVNFFEVQKAFYDFCDEHQIISGYYTVDGRRKRLSGYKQFKRWEYNWKSMVDPVTGKFPSMTAEDVINAGNAWKSMSEKSAGDWENIGISDNKRVGRVNCIAFHPVYPNVIYAGTPSGGLWKTLDHGETWTPLTDHLPTLGVSAIVIVPNPAGDILYIGTGDRDNSDSFSVGVLKSTDGGNNWTTTGLSYNTSDREQVTGLVKHPVNPNILLATTTRGFYRTSSAGNNWDLLATFPLDFAQMLTDLKLHPANPNHIYVSTGRGNVGVTQAFIYRSTDMGDTWEEIFQAEGRRIEMAVTPDKPNRLYAVVAKQVGDETPLEGVYKFTNGGDDFDKILDGDDLNLLGRDINNNGGTAGLSWYALAIAVNPLDADQIFVGGINVWMTDEGGVGVDKWDWDTFWTTRGLFNFPRKWNTHADVHQLIFRPGTSELYKCCDGGIFKRIDKRNWEGLSEGMAISQIYRLGLNTSGEKEYELLAGLQDNGTHEFKKDKWDRVHGGDGMECIIDHTKPIVQYASSQDGDIVRTKIAWYGFNPRNLTKRNGEPIPPLDETGGWVTPYSMDPNYRETLFLGLENVWKSENQGNSWEKISNWTDTPKIISLAVAPNGTDLSNPNRFIFISKDNILRYTWNSGVTWEQPTQNAPDNITYIAIKDSPWPLKVWVSMAGFNEHGVYEYDYTSDTWTNISAGLPQVPVYCVVQNKYNKADEELYAGTETGIYRKVGGADWEPFIAGLPNVRVRELEIQYSMGYTFDGLVEVATLYAATYGRGMWKSRLEKVDYRLWTGIISQDWDNPDNWEPKKVPTSITNVNVPDGCLFWPLKATLELGVDCNNLKLMENAELYITGYPGYLIIGEYKILKCESGSKLHIGSLWNNLNDDEKIGKGYGFRPDPGSEVIFEGQIPSGIAGYNSYETFENLTIQKYSASPIYDFNVHINIVVNQDCRILMGLWSNGAPLHHILKGNFDISGNAGINAPGIIEFNGFDIQTFSFLTDNLIYEAYNFLGTIKINAGEVQQQCVLVSNKKINSGLEIIQGVYRIGSASATEASGVTIWDGGVLQLTESTLYAGGIEVKEGGTLQSLGTSSDHAQITKLPGGLDFNFLIHGNIHAEYTDFGGTNQFGVHITPFGTISKINDCSFSSTSGLSNASLLRINNAQIIEVHMPNFSFLPHQRTVTKTEDQGEVHIYAYSPPDSFTKEWDPYNRVNWYDLSSLKNTITNVPFTSLEKDLTELIRIYPNPSSGLFVIENDYITESSMIFKITDLQGQEIYSGDLPAGKTTVNADNISKGVYLVKIVIDDQHIMKKIVVN